MLDGKYLWSLANIFSYTAFESIQLKPKVCVYCMKNVVMCNHDFFFFFAVFETPAHILPVTACVKLKNPHNIHAPMRRLLDVNVEAPEY